MSVPASPWLSIVVPVLDEADNLATLLSHLARCAPGAEILVVDGGSRDGSGAVVARHPGVRWIERGRGRALQMNAGARAARGEVLLFLHADTRLPEGAPAAVQRALGASGAVGGRFDVRLDSPHPAFRVIEWCINARTRLTGIATGDQAIFVRREVFELLGGYPEIALMEDVEFSRRLRRLGPLACLCPRVATSARKWEREGIARTVLLMWGLRLLNACGVAPARLHRWYYGGHAEAAPASPPTPLDPARVEAPGHRHAPTSAQGF